MASEIPAITRTTAGHFRVHLHLAVVERAAGDARKVAGWTNIFHQSAAGEVLRHGRAGSRAGWTVQGARSSATAPAQKKIIRLPELDLSKAGLSLAACY